jgi:hypothetical protein
VTVTKTAAIHTVPPEDYHRTTLNVDVRVKSFVIMLAVEVAPTVGAKIERSAAYRYPVGCFCAAGLFSYISLFATFFVTFSATFIAPFILLVFYCQFPTVGI